MPQQITNELVERQLQGLRRTQAPEVWVRQDILDHVLGSNETAKLTLAKAGYTSRRPKQKSLLAAKRDLEKYGPTDSHNLVCVDREATVEALLGAIEQKGTILPRKIEGEQQDEQY